jgi:hypothetical protein
MAMQGKFHLPDLRTTLVNAASIVMVVLAVNAASRAQVKFNVKSGLSPESEGQTG